LAPLKSAEIYLPQGIATISGIRRLWIMSGSSDRAKLTQSLFRFDRERSVRSIQSHLNVRMLKKDVSALGVRRHRAA
jgi:hypothetical protein